MENAFLVTVAGSEKSGSDRLEMIRMEQRTGVETSIPARSFVRLARGNKEDFQQLQKFP